MDYQKACQYKLSYILFLYLASIMNQEVKPQTNLMLQPQIMTLYEKTLIIAETISPKALALTKYFFELLHINMSGNWKNDKVKVSQLFPWEYQLKTHSQSPICSKRIHEASVRTAFSCFDCRQCDNSILCYECFSQSDHDGHRYIQFETSGGCCDCGDTEAWNQKGFCKRHGKQVKIEEIDDSIKQRFSKQMKFAYYLYFMLVDRFKAGKQVDRLRYRYGSVLLEYSANLVSEQYQLKYLLNYVLQQKFTEFPEIYSPQLTIIQRFFQLQMVRELIQFNKIAIELFPVEQFRYTFICKYFEKTFKNQMFLEHPLKQLNYQYMGRAKIISELIEKGKLQPLLLDQTNKMPSPEAVASLFKKYIDDITYLIKPKSAIMYFKMHFEKINVCQMFFYRQYTVITEEEQAQKILIDDFMLKIFAQILKIIKNQKHLLVKIMKQLINHILNFKQTTYSLIHERAFALTLCTYFQKPPSKMHSLNLKQHLLNILDINQNSNEIIRQCISIHLRRIATAQSFLQQSNAYQDDYGTNFLSIYPQRYLIQSLDKVYIKILSNLYQGDLPLQTIIASIIQQISLSEKNNLIFNIQDNAISLVSINIDEIIVCEQVQVDISQQFFVFLKRFLKSFPMLNAKQLKHSAKYIINNNQLIDQFLMKEVKVEKGKIISNFQEKPFQVFIYEKIFSALGIDIFKAIPTYFYKIPKIEQFKSTSIYTQKTAEIIFKIIKSTIEKVKENNNQMLQRSLSSFLASLFLVVVQIYGEIKYDNCRELFKIMMEMSFAKFINKQYIDQANFIMNIKQNSIESPQKLKQIEEGVKKKQALLKKRKEKDQMMKKKQRDLLKNYENADIQNESQVENCIYCKQNNNINLFFVSYCNFTSIYEQKCLKTEGNHLFFQSCGHKIHQECFEKYINQVKDLKVCFLCKRNVNMLMPFFSKEVSFEDLLKRGEDFASLIYPILLLKYENQEEVVQDYFNQADNIISPLIESLIKEVIFRSVYDLPSFQKEVFPVYLTIYDIIKVQDAQTIAKSLHNIKQKTQKLSIQSQFKELQILFIQILKNSLQNNYQELNFKHTKHSYIGDLLYKIMNSFRNKKWDVQQFKEVHLAEQYPIISKLPQNLIQLLPAKPQCGVCKKLSNRLLACLLCSWIGCDDDKDCMKNHVTQSHIDGSIFVFLYNGQIIYVFQNFINVIDSIYYDYLGDSMNREKRQISKQQLQKYHLDIEEFNRLKLKFIQHMIHQQAAK